MKQLSILSLLILFYGCSMTIKVLNPTPNVNIPETKSKIYLSFDGKVADHMEPVTINGRIWCHILDWHKTLQNAFNNSIGEYTKVTENKEDADYVLEIKKTEIDYETVSYVSNGIYTTSSSYVIHLTYNASLYNKAGEKIATSTHTTFSKKNFMSGTINFTNGVQSAIESMFELIAKDIFIEKI
jgi:hypothetical protein